MSDLEQSDPTGRAGAWNAPFPLPTPAAWYRTRRADPDVTFDLVHGAAQTFPESRVMWQAMRNETDPERSNVLRAALDFAYAVEDYDQRNPTPSSAA
jgi:hypothetical protein